MSAIGNQKASFSLPSLIAVIAAIFSFTTGAFWGLVLAGIAIVFGVIGLLLSLSPRVRGGFVSVFGVLAGCVGIVAAVIKAVIWIAS